MEKTFLQQCRDLRTRENSSEPGTDTRYDIRKSNPENKLL